MRPLRSLRHHSGKAFLLHPTNHGAMRAKAVNPDKRGCYSSPISSSSPQSSPYLFPLQQRYSWILTYWPLLGTARVKFSSSLLTCSLSKQIRVALISTRLAVINLSGLIIRQRRKAREIAIPVQIVFFDHRALVDRVSYCVDVHQLRTSDSRV